MRFNQNDDNEYNDIYDKTGNNIGDIDGND